MFSCVDLAAMLHLHSPTKSATLGVYEVPDPPRCGMSRASVFQLTVGMVLLGLIAVVGPMEGQSLQALGAESQVHGTITETRRATSDFGFGKVAPGDADESSVAESEADRGALSFPEALCAMGFSAIVVDECPRSASPISLFGAQEPMPESGGPKPQPAAMSDSSRENLKVAAVEISRASKPDLNRNIYYKNRLDFSLDGGWLPINIPFVFDVFLGDGYTKTPLSYTLVPIIASVRWQMDDVGGPWIFRGNWDLTTSAAVTLIPRGPETRYFAWIMGLRRNFVPRHGRIAPYFDGRLGLGNINAKEPAGVLYAQGQDFTFTVNMGSGVRYNFNPRYSISAGLNWMHISNLYLSEPRFANYGINVYGPMFGLDVRLGKPHHHAAE
jgi:lipid A 3-O-deacylase PagL